MALWGGILIVLPEGPSSVSSNHTNLLQLPTTPLLGALTPLSDLHQYPSPDVATLTERHNTHQYNLILKLILLWYGDIF